jgi:hypothetical protein
MAAAQSTPLSAAWLLVVANVCSACAQVSTIDHDASSAEMNRAHDMATAIDLDRAHDQAVTVSPAVQRRGQSEVVLHASAVDPDPGARAIDQGTMTIFLM